MIEEFIWNYISYQQDSSVLKPDIVNKKKAKIIYKTK